MNDKLISVFLITRHGARTPLHLVDDLTQIEYDKSLLEPYVKSNFVVKSLDNQIDFTNVLSYKDLKYMTRKLKGGAHVGQLTKIGEQQMFKLGVRLKHKYIDGIKFLSNEYNPGEVYVRSTHLKRTINSAKSVLAGLYQTIPTQILKKPFLINVKELETDYLYPNLLECPYIQHKREHIKKNFHFFSETNEYTKFVNNIKNKYNFRKHDHTNPLLVYEFLDEIHSRLAHGLECPLDGILDEANRFASIELGIEMMENLDINCGKFISLLRIIFSDIVMKHKNKRNDFYKLNFFSAHDNTLIALLIVLNKINEYNYILPPFGSDLIFELWEQGPNYYVKIYFNGNILNVNHEYVINRDRLSTIQHDEKMKFFIDLDTEEETTESRLEFSNFIRLMKRHEFDEKKNVFIKKED